MNDSECSTGNHARRHSRDFVVRPWTLFLYQTALRVLHLVSHPKGQRETYKDKIINIKLTLPDIKLT